MDAKRGASRAEAERSGDGAAVEAERLGEVARSVGDFVEARAGHEGAEVPAQRYGVVRVWGAEMHARQLLDEVCGPLMTIAYAPLMIEYTTDDERTRTSWLTAVHFVVGTPHAPRGVDECICCP